MQTHYAGGTSSAYDLKRFESKRMRVKGPALTVAKPTVAAERARARMTLTLKVLSVAALLIAVLVAMLYSRAVLTELTTEIATTKSQLNKQISEQTRLSAELESKISLRNVEDYATQNLGMYALDKEQITYIDLSGGDRIERTKESPRKTLIDRIKVAINNVQEYMPQE